MAAISARNGGNQSLQVINELKASQTQTQSRTETDHNTLSRPPTLDQGQEEAQLQGAPSMLPPP